MDDENEPPAWRPAVDPTLWTPQTAAAVERLYELTAEPETRTRAQMVLLAYGQGQPPREIATLVRRSAVTVRKVLRRFGREGVEGLPYRQGGGRAPTVTPAWEAELRRVIELDPRTLGVPRANWSTALLADYLERAAGLRVEQETVRRQLHRLGYVCKRPTWTLDRKAQAQEGWEGNACGRSSS
jgi:transposase